MRRALAGARVALVLAYVLLQLGSRVVAQSMQNITVDDSGPDPHTRQPIHYEGAWCTSQTCPWPMKDFDKNHTWHSVAHPLGRCESGCMGMPDHTLDASETVSATFEFTGSALYVYGVLGTVPKNSPMKTPHLSFFIDNALQKNVSYPTNTSEEWGHQKGLFFSSTSLSYSPHTFKVQTGENGVPYPLVLDYLVYTTNGDGGSHGSDRTTESGSVSAASSQLAPATPTPSPIHTTITPSSSGTNTLSSLAPANTAQASSAPSTQKPKRAAANATIALAILLGVAAIASGTWFWLRRRRRNRAAAPDEGLPTLSEPARPSTTRLYPQRDTAYFGGGQAVDGAPQGSHVTVVQLNVGDKRRSVTMEI